MYTIQSTRNNMFISSLFADKHEQTFNERIIHLAYAWSSRSDCQKVADDIGECKIVEIMLDNNN